MIYFRFRKDIQNLDLDNEGKYPNKITSFFMQTGKKYYDTEMKCLFVGKSVNGWISYSRNVDELFNIDNPERIVNRDDEIQWVKWYNRSAFWRLIKGVTKKIFNAYDWFNYIAWTNIYKFSPYNGGNPDAYLKRLQKNICIEMLDKEISYLKPKFIIFLTSNWESFYLNHINLERKNNKKFVWGKPYYNYEVYYQKYNDIIYIRSKHPERKPEKEHINTIVKIIRKYM
jgi:hypothetical protein